MLLASADGRIAVVCSVRTRGKDLNAHSAAKEDVPIRSEEGVQKHTLQLTRRAKQDSGGHDIHGKFGGSLSFRPNFAVMSEAVKCYISEAWPTDRWVPDACARTCNLVRVQGST